MLLYLHETFKAAVPLGFVLIKKIILFVWNAEICIASQWIWLYNSCTTNKYMHTNFHY